MGRRIASETTLTSAASRWETGGSHSTPGCSCGSGVRPPAAMSGDWSSVHQARLPTIESPPAVGITVGVGRAVAPLGAATRVRSRIGRRPSVLPISTITQYLNKRYSLRFDGFPAPGLRGGTGRMSGFAYAPRISGVGWLGKCVAQVPSRRDPRDRQPPCRRWGRDPRRRVCESCGVRF